MGESVTDSIKLLDWELSFELVEEYDLMELLIESVPVIIVGTLVHFDSSISKLFEESTLPSILLSVYPEVTSLLGEVDCFKQSSIN